MAAAAVVVVAHREKARRERLMPAWVRRLPMSSAATMSEQAEIG